MKENNFKIMNLIFIIIGILIALYIGKTYSIIFSLILIIFMLFWVGFLYLYYKKNMESIKEKNELINNKKKFINIENTFPFPFVIIKNDRIIYENEVFKNQLNQKDSENKNIREVLPEYSNLVRRQKINFNNKTYLLYTSLINYNEIEDAEIAYFIESHDENKNSELECTNTLVVSLILVDNLEDVSNTIEEIKRPLLTALIDRKINSLTQQVGGIVKKFEKDKYFFIFYKDKLDYLKERKFDILDQIREIDMGNKIPVTLSIGMGISNRNLSNAMDYSRQALDLSLGRGGDQVVIKDSDKFYFYGGVSKGVDSNNKVRARVKAYALGELIEEASNVIIMGHRNPDVDCLGSAVGVYSIVKSYGKKANIVLNKITTSINILYGRLEKEGNYVTDNIFINGEEANKIITDNTLLIIVDTHRKSIVEASSLLEKTNNIVVFDHHRKSTDYIDNAVLNYHEPYASSASELVTEMLTYIKYPVKLLNVEADALLAGITVDTKNFGFKTGSKTFEAAAYLRRQGADGIRVRLLFQNKMESYKAKAVAVNNAEIYNENIAISFCPSNIENPNLVASQAADDLLNIYGIQASFVLCEDKKEISISGRSLGDINVQVILEKLGGGGHQSASGAQIKNSSIDEVKELLKDTINKYNQEG